MDCGKYMCRKKVYSLQDWRKEMLRLRKEHAPQFEQHPDFVKTSQCKEYILDKPACDRRYPETKPEFKPAPKPAPKPKPKPKTPPKSKKQPKKTKAPNQAYEDELRQYEINVEALRILKESLTETTEEVKNVKHNISTYQLSEKEHTKQLNKLLSKKKPDNYLIKYYQNSIESEKANIQSLNVVLTRLESQLVYLKDAIKLLEDKIKTPVHPDAKCPKGSRKNKKTGKCDPY